MQLIFIQTLFLRMTTWKQNLLLRSPKIPLPKKTLILPIPPASIHRRNPLRIFCNHRKILIAAAHQTLPMLLLWKRNLMPEMKKRLFPIPMEQTIFHPEKKVGYKPVFWTVP